MHSRHLPAPGAELQVWCPSGIIHAGSAHQAGRSLGSCVFAALQLPCTGASRAQSWQRRHKQAQHACITPACFPARWPAASQFLFSCSPPRPFLPAGAPEQVSDRSADPERGHGQGGARERGRQYDIPTQYVCYPAWGVGERGRSGQSRGLLHCVRACMCVSASTTVWPCLPACLSACLPPSLPSVCVCELEMGVPLVPLLFLPAAA